MPRAADIASNFFGQSTFATHALTYERNVVEVPEDMPLALCGPLGCGIQTGAGGVMRSLACEAGSSLLITGGGPVGLSAVMGAKIQGCGAIILVEPHAARRDSGAGIRRDPCDRSRRARRSGSRRPRDRADGVDYAFDTTGVPAVHAAVMAALAPKGVFGHRRHRAAGHAAAGRGQHRDDLRSYCEGDHRGRQRSGRLPATADRAPRRGDLPFERMITTFPFHRINEAIAAQQRGECVKVVLLMPD